MPSPQKSVGQDPLVKGLFRDQHTAERAFHIAKQQGYSPTDITAVMNDETRDKLLAADSHSALAHTGGDGDAKPIGEQVGGPVGATVATIAPALAAVGTVLLIPGIVALGPIAVAVAAAGTMGVGAGLIGALAHWGIPPDQVKEYETAIQRGDILLAVTPRNDVDRRKLIQSWASIGGVSVQS